MIFFIYLNRHQAPNLMLPQIMKLLKSNLLTVVLLCLVMTSCSKEDINENEQARYEIDLNLVHQNDEQMASRILELVNDHRNSIGLTPLQMDNMYAAAFAVDHTNHMIAVEKLSHDNFGYRSNAIKYHDDAEDVGENVAYGYDTAETVVNAWLNSPGHKANMEGDYTHSGFGVKKSSKGRTYFTQLFYKK